jgi:hypothetical protein
MRPDSLYSLIIVHVFLDQDNDEVKVDGTRIATAQDLETEYPDKKLWYQKSYQEQHVNDEYEDYAYYVQNYTEYRDPAFDRGVTFGI